MFVEQNEFRGWSMLTINYARTLDVLLMANAAFFFYLSSSRCVCVCVNYFIIFIQLFAWWLIILWFISIDCVNAHSARS